MSYRLGKKLLAKITVRGKTLTLYLALDVKDYNPNKYFQKDMSDVKAYSDVPFSVKVKSNRGIKNAKILIEELMNKNGVIKTTEQKNVNSIRLLEEFLAIDVPEGQKVTIKAKRIPFYQKIFRLNSEEKEYFNLLHNEFISHKKISSRLSFKCMSYRLGRKLLAKMAIRGKTLRLYLALDVNSFNYNVFFQKDMSEVKAYSEVPFSVKVKSNRGSKNALKLITKLMEKENVVKKPNFTMVDTLLELRKIAENGVQKTDKQ